MAQRRLSLVLDLDTGRYSGRLTQAGAQMRNFGGTVDRTNRQVRQMTDGFNRMGSSMSTPLQKLRDYVLILGNIRLALINVRDIAVGWVASLVMQSAQVERLTVMMKGMSSQMTEAGKTAEATRNIGELFDMARRTGFAMDALADSFVKFQSGKLDPRNGSLQALADSVAAFGGTSDVMHRASIAIQQMAGKGVISMEELRQQLGEAVPTAMSLMARAMGKTVMELSKQVETGTVRAGPALALMFAEMQRTYAGAGGKLAQTFTGQLAEMRTNIMQLSTEFTGLGKKEGLFATSTNSLKQFNELLRGSEGKAIVAGLGNAINAIATSLVGAAKVAVQFRSEIGAALQAVAIGIALITAKRFSAWIMSGATDAIASVGKLSAAFRAAGAEMQAYRQVLGGNMAGLSGMAAGGGVGAQAAAMQGAIAAGKARIDQERTLIGVTRQAQVENRATIQGLQQKAAALRDIIPQMEAQIRMDKQRLRSAQTLHQANLAVGRDATVSAQNVAAAERQLMQSTNNLGLTRTRLRLTTRQTTVAEAELAAAMNAEAAAAGRLAAAETTTTLAKRAMATAATVAAGATRLLQGAMALALNPIVMIGVVLYQAASAAGVFETKADRAAQAADRLRQGLGSLADMEAAVERRRQIRKEIADNQDVNPLLGVSVVRDGWNSGLNIRSNDQRAAERERLRKEDAGLASTIAGAKAPLAMQAATNNWQSISDRRNTVMNRMSADFAQQSDKLAAQLEAGDKSAAGKLQALQAQQDRRRASIDRGIYQTVKADYDRAKRAGKPQEVLDALASRVTSAREQWQTTQSGMTATSNALAASTGGAAKGLDKFARAAVNADAKTAGLEAAMAGRGKKMAEFETKLKGGMFKGMSEDQIGSLRRAAQAQDAFAAAKKSAAQDDGFEAKLVAMSGRLAQLQDDLEGGGGELAKFNAQLKASPDKLGLNPEQISVLRELAGNIDKTKHDQDVKRVTDDLDSDLKRATAESNALWSSFGRGTMEADARLASIKARFEDKLVGLSGQELTDAQAKIDKIVRTLQMADSIDAVQGWQQQAGEIQSSLLSEDEQREANFQRELFRQQTILDGIRANTAAQIADMSLTEAQRNEAWERRKMAEASFFAWRGAAERKMAVDHQSVSMRMLRGWVDFGSSVNQTMQNYMDGMVDGLNDKKFDFKQFSEDMLVEIGKIILKAMIAYAILAAIGMNHNSTGGTVSMGSFIKGQMTGAMGGEQSSSRGIGFGASGAKSNGIVAGDQPPMQMVGPDVFGFAKNLPTRHNGGWLGGRQLRPGEVPFIGLEDEVILNKQQQRTIGGMMSGGGAPSVQVNVINNSGTELETEHGDPEFNGKEMIVNVVVEAAQKQGKLRDVFTSLAGSK